MFHLFRLYYLCEDALTSFIKEELFFICLTRLHPVLSGIVVSMLLGEDFLSSNESHTSHIFYSSCSKTPFVWKGVSETRLVMGLSQITLITVSLVTHLLLFIRQRQLQKLKNAGVMIEMQNSDGIKVSRRSSDLQTKTKLWRHNRTVVTPEASLFSFLASLVVFSVRIYNHIHNQSGPSTFGRFLAFSHFLQLFFLCNMIETIFSPTLRSTLPWSRQTYYVCNV